MLSSKTYTFLNTNKFYFKRTLFAINDRFVTFTPNQSPKHPNVISNEYKFISFRHLSDGRDGRAKSGKKSNAVKASYVEDEPKLSHMERLKRVFQNYGTTAVVLHIAISLTSLGIWYCLVYFGVDITAYIDLDKFGETAGKVMAGSGTFAVAYALHKMIMPVRVSLTVLLTPVVVRQLRAIGIIKKPHKPL